MSPKIDITNHPYRSKYPRLPTFDKKSDSLGFVFGDGVSNHGAPLVSRNSVQLLPGLRSFDPIMQGFLRELRDTCNANIKNGVDADGFSSNGVPANFDTFCTVAGFGMSAISYVPTSNAAFRKELGLNPGLTDRQRSIATNVWRLVWGSYKPGNIRVAKGTGGGARRYSKDATWKADYARYVTHPNIFPRMLSMVNKRDWYGLATVFEAVYMMDIQKRNQVDVVGKQRFVFDYEYAISGGKAGKTFAADKKVTINGSVWDTFSATRTRTVNAGPWCINCVLSIMATGTLNALLSNFPKVFHTTTPLQINQLIDGAHIVCGDVPNFDRLVSGDEIDLAHLIMGEFWDGDMVAMSRLLSASPYYARPLNFDDKEGHWVGNPKDMDINFIKGQNRSGTATTSLFAKVFKFCDDLFRFDFMGLPVLGNEVQFMKGEGPINVINNGDDGIIYSEDEYLINKYLETLKQPSAGSYVVLREVGHIFNGLDIYFKDKLALTYNVSQKITTGIHNTYIRERGIDKSPFWWIGAQTRELNRNLTDASREMWDIHDYLYDKHIDASVGSIADMIFRARDLADLQISDFTALERAVIDDPAKLYYSIDESDIRQEVLDLVTAKLPYKDIAHIVDGYYVGDVMQSPGIFEVS